MMKFRVLIPAGGLSSRSGLNYPKTLYKIEGIPILIRICKLVEAYDRRPVIIINPSYEVLFRNVLDEYQVDAELVFQDKPKGMGDAVLQADSIIDEQTHIILIWSDIPLLNRTTLDHLVNCHITCNNHLSLITSLGPNCYTIVEREDGKLLRVKETRALGIPPKEYGERDIGLFLFQKRPVFDILKTDSALYKTEVNREHGFLYIIEQLVIRQKKLEGYPIAMATDILSFNTPEELKLIEEAVMRSPH